MAAIGLVSIAAFFCASPSIDKRADTLVRALSRSDWAVAYTSMGAREKSHLRMGAKDFSTFCNAIAAGGWPSNKDKPELEEMTPYSPSGTQNDTAWHREGTRRYNVSFRRPDGKSELLTKLEFRHDAEGSWDPDVLPLVLSISRGTPHSKPIQALLAAMKSIHRDSLDTYPLHQRTTIAKLTRTLAEGRKIFLESPIQHFH